ncbi:N-acetylglucosamine-6-phosphate deacetylase [Pseudolysinimonas kribbensis]|uniref:N-acetylglucosamine-6-phosphate deacetylase n=1 Tax=Pseudolysinimonas kribbensis TaxID=433641 RepID=A0ABQ6K5E7_9MICO|nr:amidohydrolase family protein [Pseudolysinimonas kribbensis]GMA94082.1 N-acetylglucosamine-6-phosphate deacetylase [Pseudolysinimonas kribbensis]
MDEWSGHLATGEPVRVRAAGGVVTAIEPASEHDVPDVWIVPGLVDLQVNGIADLDLNRGDPSPETVAGVVRALQREGVTRFLPTVGTASEEHITAAVRAIADACDADPDVARAVAGIHVEGPFISGEDGPRGVHDPAAVRPADPDEVRRWQEAARGRIRMVTFAPESPGALDLVQALVREGIIAAIGHGAPTEEQVQAAADAGATMSTHLGNGAAPMLRRHPNHLWAQLADDRLWAGLIGDGFHLPASTLTTMIRAKGDKAILVSDVGSLARMPAGRYSGRHHTDVVLEPSGRLHIAGSELLAGSASTLRDSIANVARRGIVPLARAVELASRHPARLLGLDADGAGDLAVGAAADLVVLHRTDDLAVAQTVVAGRTVHRAAS